MSFILASTSARRKELLDRICTTYEIVSSPADEKTIQNLPPLELVQAKARLKGQAVFEARDDHIVIGCDTIIAQGDKVFEKPRDREDVVHFLQAFSNQTHSVLSAVSVFIPDAKMVCEERLMGLKSSFVKNVALKKLPNGYLFEFIGECGVHFSEINEEDAAAYAETPEPYDKAGGYGIQASAAKWVDGVTGDYNSVVGLPLGFLSRVLRVLNAL